jgi:hypothetical protein
MTNAPLIVMVSSPCSYRSAASWIERAPSLPPQAASARRRTVLVWRIFVAFSRPSKMAISTTSGSRRGRARIQILRISSYRVISSRSRIRTEIRAKREVLLKNRKVLLELFNAAIRRNWRL